MTFAKLEYSNHYEEKHDEIVSCLKRSFKEVSDGLQSDSWIKVLEGDHAVIVDTFEALQHEVKSSERSYDLVKRVIEALEKDFEVTVYEEPINDPYFHEYQILGY